MILALIVGAGLLGLAGTRLSSGVWTAAAVSSLVLLEGSTAIVAFWVLVLVALTSVVEGQTRAAAAAAVGVGAALVAVTSSNGAAFLPAWAVSSASCLLVAGPAEGARRWRTGFLMADLPVAAAVVWGVQQEGFVGWWGADTAWPASLMLVAGCVKALTSPTTGAPWLVGRAQALLLVSLGVPALGARLPVAAAAGLLLAGSIMFTSERWISSFETGLAVAMLGGIGGQDPGLMIALGAGTILHLLWRSPNPPTWEVARRLFAGRAAPGMLWPAVALVAIEASRSAGPGGAAVLVGVLIGMSTPRLLPSAPGFAPVRWPTALAAVGLVPSWAAVASTLDPYTHVGSSGVVVVAFLAGGAALVTFVTDRGLELRQRSEQAARRPSWRTPELLGHRVVWASFLGLVTSTAVVLWAIGWSRGFI